MHGSQYRLLAPLVCFSLFLSCHEFTSTATIYYIVKVLLLHTCVPNEFSFGWAGRSVEWCRDICATTFFLQTPVSVSALRRPKAQGGHTVATHRVLHSER